MNDLERFQALQVLLVRAGLDTTLSARRERDQAVFSLGVDLHDSTPETMARLSELTAANGFAFTVDDNTASIVPRAAAA